jgi:hypothetical protein
MTMRGRIRSLAQSAGATPTRTATAARAVSAISRSRPARPEPADRPGTDTFEWDMRKSDGPTDAAFYDCACGFQFTAPVETTVRCPHCGNGQAW